MPKAHRLPGRASQVLRIRGKQMIVLFTAFRIRMKGKKYIYINSISEGKMIIEINASALPARQFYLFVFSCLGAFSLLLQLQHGRQVEMQAL